MLKALRRRCVRRLAYRWACGAFSGGRHGKRCRTCGGGDGKVAMRFAAGSTNAVPVCIGMERVDEIARQEVRRGLQACNMLLMFVSACCPGVISREVYLSKHPCSPYDFKEGVEAEVIRRYRRQGRV